MQKVKPKIPTDPKLYGPVWVIIHIKAKHATTDQRKSEFIDFMYLLSVEFPCGKCRDHIQEYLSTHPFDAYMNLRNEKDEDIGMFKWAWMFHNTVNLRLHKPFIDWETALEMYDSGREVCTNCNAANSAANSVDNSPANSLDNSPNASYEEKPKGQKIDKKKIIQGYFLKKK